MASHGMLGMASRSSRLLLRQPSRTSERMCSSFVVSTQGKSVQTRPNGSHLFRRASEHTKMDNTKSVNSPASGRCFSTESYTEAEPLGNSAESDNRDNSSSEEPFETVEDIRTAVLNAGLQHVKQLGWTTEAVAAGAASLGYSPMAHGLAASGGIDLFLHLAGQLNLKTEEHLRQLTSASALTYDAVVISGLKFRLTLVADWLDVWEAGVSTLLLAGPGHASSAIHPITELADHVVSYAGDTSTGFSWYTRRTAVCAVYGAAELYLLQDSSAGHQDTMRLVERRVADLCGCGGAKDVAGAVFHTGLNIAGLNRFSR